MSAEHLSTAACAGSLKGLCLLWRVAAPHGVEPVTCVEHFKNRGVSQPARQAKAGKVIKRKHEVN
jgi:hypothetical protein